MSPAGGLAAASMPANNSDEVTSGPFEWAPNINAYGHDCVLDGRVGRRRPEQRRQLHARRDDPGVAARPQRQQRRPAQRPARARRRGRGGAAPAPRSSTSSWRATRSCKPRARCSCEVELPQLLAARGWRAALRAASPARSSCSARARSGWSRIELVAGTPTSPRTSVDGTPERDIAVTLLADGMVLGGMTYRLDPSLKAPPRPGDRPDCRGRARDLLRCLDIPDAKVRDVHVTKVSIDVCMDDDCC